MGTKKRDMIWFSAQKPYDPPFEKCHECFYWRSLLGDLTGDRGEMACHFCYFNGKSRDGDLTYCNSFDPTPKTRRRVRPYEDGL